MLFSIFGVLLGGIFAYDNHFLTVSQMKMRGIERGLPFIAHGGMWGDLLIVTPIAGMMVYYHGEQWTLLQIIICSIGGVVASGLMHQLYLSSAFPEAHIKNHKLTEAGMVHVVYMAGMLSIMFLFYFCTGHVSPSLVITSSILLTIHIMFGNHIPLGLWRPTWYGRKPDMTAYVTVMVTGIVLAWRTFAIIH